MSQLTLTASEIVALFNATFFDSEQTKLIGGAPEPLYLPRSQRVRYHRIYFRQDYVRSALHEIAHWCVAGPIRRQIPDYGYWYIADGRNESQQQAFEQAEVQPQAFEWLFSLSCGQKFEVSLDNLMGRFTPDRSAFTRQVVNYGLDFYKQRNRTIFQRFWQFQAALETYFKSTLTEPLTKTFIEQEAQRLLLC